MFAVRMSMGADLLADLSIPQMVDHVEYLNAMNERG